MQAIHILGQEDAQRQLVRKCYTWLYENTKEIKNAPVEVRDIYEKFKQYKKNDTNTHYLLTLNYSYDTLPEEILSDLEKILTKTWIKVVLYCHEGDFKTKHPHIHMLIKKNKVKSEIIREIYNTVKYHIPDKAYIDCRYIKEKDVETVLNYIKKDGDYHTHSFTDDDLVLDE